VQDYIPESASFETYKEDRRIRNGHLSFFVKGYVSSSPLEFITIEGFEIRMAHSKVNKNPKKAPPQAPVAQAPTRLRAQANAEASTQAPAQTPTQPQTKPHLGNPPGINHPLLTICLQMKN